MEGALVTSNNQLFLFVWRKDPQRPGPGNVFPTAQRLSYCLERGRTLDRGFTFGGRDWFGLRRWRCNWSPTTEALHPISGADGFWTRLCPPFFGSPDRPLLASSGPLSFVFLILLCLPSYGNGQRRVRWVSGAGRSHPTPFRPHWGRQFGYLP